MSASAMRGVVGEREASIEALVSMSVMVARPMSGMPRRDIVVPAPVWGGGSGGAVKGEVRGMWTYHVETVCAFLERYTCGVAIVYAGTDDEFLRIGEHDAQLLDCCERLDAIDLCHFG